MLWSTEKDQLGRDTMLALYERGLMKTWYRDRREGWELVSGRWSPFYLQLRPLCSFPDLLKSVGYALSRVVANEVPDATRLVGIAMAGIPIALAASFASGITCTYTRKLEGVRSVEDLRRVLESYGEHRMLEGEVGPGDRLVFVDDLVTGLDSKLIAIEQVRAQLAWDGVTGCATEDVLVLVDREQGAQTRADELGVRLHSLIPFRSQALEWLRDNLAPVEYDVISDYLSDPDAFQDAADRERVIALAPS